MNTYDCIVVGLGGVGSATLYHLAQRGVSCLGIEQFSIAHDRGSSHGHSRIIRRAYFEHPDYVPLLHRAYELWDRLEQETQSQLFYRVGLAQFGPPDGEIIRGIEASAAAHHLPIDRPSAQEFEAAHPQFQVPADMAVIVEQDAGVLHVEQCVRSHLELAKSHGAHIRSNTALCEIRQRQKDIELVTEQESFTCRRLVLACGAWAPQLVGLSVPFRVVKKHLHWFETTPAVQSPSSPAFFFHMPNGYFYGTPGFAGLPMKVAEHSGGEPVSDPSTIGRDEDESDRRRIDQFLSTVFRFDTERHVMHDVCQYTMTPDEHFILDVHPQHKQIMFAAGLSGHGFKFTPVLGEVLAQLAIDGKSTQPIEFLRANRFDPPVQDCV